jgi:FMN phosphatase YigB (HAD superfamily)
LQARRRPAAPLLTDMTDTTHAPSSTGIAAGLAELAFLFDVDDTLLDNDRFAIDLAARLERDFGTAERERYQSIYEARREALGYADYLGALQAFRIGCEREELLLGMSDFLLDYPFAERLYPGALEAVAHLRTLGPAAILSDGDIVFQPRKIRRAGLWDAVDGQVLVTVHKEHALDAVLRRFPARRHVMVDDKPQLLAAMKRALGDRLVTVFVRQGHYAEAARGMAIEPPPDLTVAAIGELRTLSAADLPAALPEAAPPPFNAVPEAP